MNKELYRSIIENSNELRKLKFVLDSLRLFLKKNENSFKNEESINSLRRIKVYLENVEKDYQRRDLELRRKRLLLYSTCEHEVAIKSIEGAGCRCLICNKSFSWCDNIFPNEVSISVDVTRDYQVANIIGEIFEHAVYSDGDLVETISDALEELQYDRNIKVYRRSR